jgi:hypothetical protein
MTWPPRVMMPAELTSRCTSTQRGWFFVRDGDIGRDGGQLRDHLGGDRDPAAPGSSLTRILLVPVGLTVVGGLVPFDGPASLRGAAMVMPSSTVIC